MDQSIDKDFSKLGALGALEKTQFANEAGVHRSALNMSLALNKCSSLTFTQLHLADEHGAMSREGIAYTAKGIELKYNIGDTAKDFARAVDLAAMTGPEKAAIEGERGYRRTDWAAKITALKGFNIDSSDYRAGDGRTS